MKDLMDFKLWEPSCLEEAMRLLVDLKGQAKPLAGGTDLFIRLKTGKLSCPNLVDLQGIPSLTEYDVLDRHVIIGSMIPVSKIEWDENLRSSMGFLCEAAGLLGSRQVRNIATVGGNLCNAAPSAELATPLLIMDAEANIVGPEGRRVLPLNQFFTGPGQTALAYGELLESVEFVVPEGKWTARYYKLAPRKAMDIAIVNVCVKLLMDEQDPKRIKDAAIAVGAVSPTPVRLSAAEEMLRGQVWTKDMVEKVSLLCANSVHPISDVRSSAAYRKEMVQVLVRRGLTECYKQFWDKEDSQ